MEIRRMLFGALALVTVIVVTLLLPSSAHASHEEFAVYETWDTPLMRADRWAGLTIFLGLPHEVRVEVEAGTLRARLRHVGLTTSDAGRTSSALFVLARNPLLIDQIEATFTVTSVTVTGCDANPQASRARPAQLWMGRMNDGSGSEGDRTGDHHGAIQAVRDHNSPPGLLGVAGFINRCSDPACTTTTSPYVAELGTVTIGSPFTLRMVWDSPNNRFIYKLNNGPDVFLVYDEAINMGEAIVPFVSVATNPSVPNCTAGPSTADAATQVGQVQTNTSAIVP